MAVLDRNYKLKKNIELPCTCPNNLRYGDHTQFFLNIKYSVYSPLDSAAWGSHTTLPTLAAP
jgi:hypothetical protein